MWLAEHCPLCVSVEAEGLGCWSGAMVQPPLLPPLRHALEAVQRLVTRLNASLGVAVSLTSHGPLLFSHQQPLASCLCVCVAPRDTSHTPRQRVSHTTRQPAGNARPHLRPCVRCLLLPQRR